MSSSSNISVPPGPWKLKATSHLFFLYTTAKDIERLDKSFLYSPLEADSTYSNGKLVGGLAGVYVIRYHESPVGPYDELIIIPGKYEYQREVTEKDGTTRTITKQNLRISKIYVSTKEACLGGRRNWNIPKHLARFEFKDLPHGTTYVAIYPNDANSQTPLLKIKYKQIPYSPGLPASTNWSKYLGLDFTHVQPPLPKGDEPELEGTEDWCSFLPIVSSSKTTLEWCDLKQNASEDDPLLDEAEPSDVQAESNWWPGLGRWRIGMRMDDADVQFPVGEHWKGLI